LERLHQEFHRAEEDMEKTSLRASRIAQITALAEREVAL